MSQNILDQEKHDFKGDLIHMDGYLNIFDDLPNMMWRSGSEAKADYFNHSWLYFTGRSLEQELGSGWIENIYLEDVERWLTTYNTCFNYRQPFEIEFRLRHFSGEYRWVQNIGRPYDYPDGSFAGYINTCVDVTDRKQMEKALVETNQALETTNAALRRSEAMFKALFEHAPDAVLAVNESAQIVLANEQAQSLFGYQRGEIIGQSIEMLMPGVFQERHRNHVSNYMAHPHQRPMGQNMVLFGERKDGQRFPVDINLGPLQTEGGLVVLATIRDMTERLKKEEAIQERENLLTAAAMSSPLVFFKVNHEGILNYSIGQSLARRLNNVDPVGKSIDELYRDVPQVINYIHRALAGETITAVIEVGGFIYEATYVPQKNEKGEIVSVVGVAADVTRHRQVEAALRESEEHFRTIFYGATLGIFLIDPTGQLLESNPAFQDMLGWSAEELREKHFTDLSHPQDQPLFQRKMDELAEGHQDRFQSEQRFIHKDGQTLWGRLAISLFRGQAGVPLYGIGMVENITAQKQAEAELAELQRGLIDSAEIERLQLAQELHDGPLQDLQAMAFELASLEGVTVDEAGQQSITSLQEEMSRVVQAIRSVCGELRPPSLAPFGLEKAILSHAEHFREQHPEIQLHLNLEKDQQELSERIRLALFRIYQHSMANIVSHAQAKNVQIQFHFDQEQIHLRIMDDGRGFKVPRRWIELVRQKHFGLVGSIERAESVGGKFEIQSSPGSGTTIHVVLPRREEEQITARERFSSERKDGAV